MQQHEIGAAKAWTILTRLRLLWALVAAGVLLEVAKICILLVSVQ